VLIIDHHQGYIAWDEYQQNQRLIAENTNMRGQMAMRQQSFPAAQAMFVTHRRAGDLTPSRIRSVTPWFRDFERGSLGVSRFSRLRPRLHAGVSS
jgi:hypothetical protein